MCSRWRSTTKREWSIASGPPDGPHFHFAPVTKRVHVTEVDGKALSVRTTAQSSSAASGVSITGSGDDENRRHPR